MANSKWYANSWRCMEYVRKTAINDGLTGLDVSRAIDNSYPFYQRSGWPYKAWLRARRDFLQLHQLPRRNDREPKVKQQLRLF